MKSLAILIPTYNRKELLRISLGQILNQTAQINHINFKIIVINDSSNDGTSKMLSQNFPDVIVLNTTGDFWYTRSINVGFKKALDLRVDCVLTLNDDIELKEDYFFKITSIFFNFLEPVVLGSTSLTYEKPHKIYFSGIYEVIWWRFKQKKYHSYLQKVNLNDLNGIRKSIMLPGRGMLISSTILKKIGFFDSRLLQYASDDEFCLRATKFGFKVLISWESIIYSHHKLTGEGSPELKQSFFNFTKSFFNKYSRTYWKKNFLITWKYGKKHLFPITIFIIFIGDYYSYLKHLFNRK